MSEEINQSAGQCPKCKEGEIVEREKFWGCSRWGRDADGAATGCDFKLWKEVAHGKITEKDLRKLVAGEITRKIKMRSKAGKDFEAPLRLNQETWRVDFVFGEDVSTTNSGTTPGAAIGVCPQCHEGSVIAFGAGWQCGQCSWKLWRRKCDAVLSEDMAKTLISGGVTPMLAMTSREGKKFKAAMSLKEDGSVELRFSEDDHERAAPTEDQTC